MRVFSFASVFAAIFATEVSAQQSFNPQSFGHWVFETAGGIEGSVTIGPNNCQYSLTTSFSSAFVYCQAVWNPYDKSLTVQGLRTTTAITVPDYQLDRSVIVSSGSGQPIISFYFDKITTRSMKGHMIGVGDNVHVTLKKH